MSDDTQKRDVLFRTLYLRREYGLLAALSRQAAAAEADLTAAADPSELPGPSVEEPLGLDALCDVVLLPPPNAVGALSRGLGGAGGPIEGASHQSGTQHQQQQQQRELLAACWRGFVHVRHRSSPWYGAIFAFVIHFPERYPFDCPTILFEHGMRSHPLLGGRHSQAEGKGGAPSPSASTAALAGIGVRVPYFDATYCSVDPMRVSVMALALRHVKQLFYPSAWPAAWTGGAADRGQPSAAEGAGPASAGRPPTPPPHPSGTSVVPVLINRILARRDVRRYGLLSRGVVLGQPLTDLLADEVSQHLVHFFEQEVATAAQMRRGGQPRAARQRLTEGDDADDAVVVRWSEWYNRVLLPTLLSLP